MLAPDDRSVLLDLLRPPPGAALDVAVATTFTLDLEAALVAPLAFAAFDAIGPGDPVATLEAIRSVASKLTVFCQAGEVRVPARASDLFSFLEPVVQPVHRPRPGFLFHPKLWVLRYMGDEGETLRLVAPTRNLTNDASWDAVLRLDGVTTGGPKASNRPLADLIRWCIDHTLSPMDSVRTDAISELIESVRRADWELPDSVNELVFHALGIGRRELPDFSGRRHLVASPFVNDAGIERVAPSDDIVLVSRPDELEMLSPDLLAGLDCRSVASMDASTDDEGVGDDASGPAAEALGELHAKVIVAERGRRAHLFVGSANATGAAFGGNIEVLVELVGGPKNLGIDAILKDLGPVLEPCSANGGREPTDVEELRRALDELLRAAALMEIRLHPALSYGGTYTVTLETAAPLVSAESNVTASLELLSRPGHAITVEPGSSSLDAFEHVPLPDLTPFVVLRVELHGPQESVSGGTVLRGVLVDDPDGRLDAVIARQVDSPAKFLRFLFLLLSMAGGALPPWLRAAIGAEDGSTGGPDERRMLELGVFEAVTRGLASHPEVLDDLGRLVARLRTTDEGRAALPDGFDELWNAVALARETIR